MKLLLVEDDISVNKLISNVAKESQVEILVAQTKKKGLQIFKKHHPEILILDGVLPDGHGFDLAREIRTIEQVKDDFRSFIIFLTSLWKDEDLLKWLESGGDIYVVKDSLASRLAIIQAQIQVAKRNIQLQQSLRIASTTDSLTGLLNRRSFDKEFDQFWQKSILKQESIGIIFIDIDNFKKYNDTYGHQKWDVCLVKIANILLEITGNCPSIKIWRYGWEEFVLLAGNSPTQQDLMNVANYIQKQVLTLDIEHKNNIPYHKITLSMWINRIQPTVDSQKWDFFRQADEALYQSKLSWRNKATFVKYT